MRSLPQLSDYSQLLLEVATGKADATFFNRVLANRYLAKNPGQLKEISSAQPVRVYGECFLLPIGDYKLKSMIDATILELIENGFVDRAFAKHGENPREYFRPLVPYRPPEISK